MTAGTTVVPDAWLAHADLLALAVNLYDASCVARAAELSAPLLTLDARLARSLEGECRVELPLAW